MLERGRELTEIRKRLKTNPVVALLGVRQCGKTTLAKQLGGDAYFDLENPRDLASLEEPLLALEDQRGLIIIDEVQRKADLFPVLRSLVDADKRKKFLILGSASPHLLRQSSETLAGRISFFELGGFDFVDVGSKEVDKLWLRGGLPRSFLARTNSTSLQWREDYISTFLERDIPQFGIRIPSPTLRRFWTMLAHYHGQIIQFAELARSFGISDMTARHYLEVLASTFAVQLLQPWHENIGKRQVKQPKLYFRDTGLLHSLLGLRSDGELNSHPKVGASWEGFVFSLLERRLRLNNCRPYFWATHAGAELDFFWSKGNKRYGAEVKYADAPRLTPSMRSAQQALKLNKLFVIFPGKRGYRLSDNIEVLTLSELDKVVRG